MNNLSTEEQRIFNTLCAIISGEHKDKILACSVAEERNTKRRSLILLNVKINEYKNL